MELNPNHPTTSAMRDNWHKIATVLVNRIPGKRTLLTFDEIKQLETGLAITIKDVGVGLELRVLTLDEAKKLASQEGGLPV